MYRKRVTLMKLISFVVPSYNSEAYLHRCIDTLLFDLERVEVIKYKKKNPNTVKVIEK